MRRFDISRNVKHSLNLFLTDLFLIGICLVLFPIISFGQGESYPTWEKEKVYYGGDRVTWKNHNWEAKWWTQREEPNPNNEWGVWKDLGASSTDPDPQKPKGVLFDDFSYQGRNDQNLLNSLWILRSGGGGPGVSGVSWLQENIDFLADSADSSNRVMQLSATTTGTGVNTSQAEIYTPQKFLEGTYAARIYFTDAPTVGTVDGDQVVETFFTITPLVTSMDPNYSEIDFEYLPNGGWGVSSPVMHTTTWETYQPDPWKAVNQNNHFNKSFAGWHTMVFQVANGEVKYYIDGQLQSTHGGIYYPETVMSINFNLWFINNGLVNSTESRTYTQQVDWVYHVQNKVISPAEVEAEINQYRIDNTDSVNTIQ